MTKNAFEHSIKLCDGIRTFKWSKRGPISSPPPTPNNDVNMPMTRATIGKVDEKSDQIMSPKMKMHAIRDNKI